MNCYLFRHPHFGKLRMVEKDGEFFYYLLDVMKIFSKRGSETFQIIANSEGEVVEFYFMMAPPVKFVTNFFTDEELEYRRKRRTKNINTDKIFIDEQLLRDMETCKNDTERLAAKWINGYIKKVLSSDVSFIWHKAKGVVDCGDYGLLNPMDIRNTKYGLFINHDYFEIEEL